ncbi:MAG: AhpC/TSA family protein [Armatimonadetes bacterium]|nr:AhpC/TSA family protein [Armatimonadota bacterium]
MRLFALPVLLLAVVGFQSAPNQGSSPVALKAGDAKPITSGPAPDGKLLTVEGKETTLKAVLGGRPAVLIFYRGSWCPFCMRHLADLATVSGDIKKLGVQLVAISPDLPAGLKAAIEKDKVDYNLFSDGKAELIRKFGLAFKVDDATIERYKGFGVDLEKVSGESHHILPVPAVYVVDASGTIRYVHYQPDYKVRLSGAAVLEAAKKVSQPAQLKR